MDNYTTRGFYQQIKNTDLARLHLWEVYLPGRFGEDSRFYIESTNWPEKSLGTIPVPFLGFEYKLPGTTKFSGTWNFNVRADMNYTIRDEFNDWLDEIYNYNTGASETFGRMEDASLALLDNKLRKTKEIKMVGCFPVSVGDIQFVQDQGETVVVFPVTLAFQWWELDRQANQGNVISLDIPSPFS